MITKILNIGNLLTIKLTAPKDVINDIINHFPNTIELVNTNNYDYMICYTKIKKISDDYKCINSKNITIPFRNSRYFVYLKNTDIIAYAKKQDYSDEHLIVRNNKNISILTINDSNSKNLIRLIIELKIRKLLEKDYFPIHASCVVKDNKAILYFGEKNSGKSTILLSSVLYDNSFPLSNDITFIGIENGIWNAYGTSYDLTFDEQLLNEFTNNNIDFSDYNLTKQYASDKIRYAPSDFCYLFNTIWQWSAPIKSINLVNLNPDQDFQMIEKLEPNKSLEYLVKYGQDAKFVFGDLLLINDLEPEYLYERLSKEIDFNEIKGNVLNYHKSRIKNKQY